jgi:hypothetical protein
VDASTRVGLEGSLPCQSEKGQGDFENESVLRVLFGVAGTDLVRKVEVKLGVVEW